MTSARPTTHAMGNPLPSPCQNKPDPELRQTFSAPPQPKWNPQQISSKSAALLAHAPIFSRLPENCCRRPKIHRLQMTAANSPLCSCKSFCRDARSLYTNGCVKARTLAAPPAFRVVLPMYNPAIRGSRSRRCAHVRSARARREPLRRWRPIHSSKTHLLRTGDESRQPLREFHFQRVRQRKTVALRQLCRHRGIDFIVA